MAERCVRVDPPVLEFKDVEAGQVYRRAVTVTNTGRAPKRIIIEKPANKLFSFIPSRQAKFVPSGLSVSGLLEFTPDAEEEVREHIQVYIDNETLRIPVLGSPRVCSLMTDSLLDFGCVVASSQTISKLHPITNEGSAPGTFHFEYSGEDSSLSVSPSYGVVAAGSTQWLKVELHTDRPRQIHDEALVRLQNRSAVVLRIRAQVVEQHLEVVNLKGSSLTCLWFGPVYFGTSREKKVVVRNNGPQTCDWVCVLQENAAGTEMGTDLRRSTDATLVAGTQKCSSADFQSPFLVCMPSHGRMGPYEKTTMTVRFSPVCKRRTQKNSGSRQDYCLFLLFDIVDSKHGFTHQKANSSVEVAVTGSGVPVSLVPAPSHRFDFLSCAVGQSLDLLCVLQNLCPQLPVSFRFGKVAHFAATPSTGTVGPGQRQDVVLTFSARQQGSFHVHQQVDVLGPVASQKNATQLEVSCFHTITLHLSASCHNVTTPPLPGVKSAAGFQPRRQCSGRSHCKGLPPTAALASDKTQLRKNPSGNKGSPKGKESLACPDDRGCGVGSASSDQQHRTIITNVPRYRCVDEGYAFTEKEEEQRRRHRQIYVDFVNQLRQTRLQRRDRQEEAEDHVDIGIVPSQGLVPPTVHISDLEISENSTSTTHRSNNQVRSKVVDVVKAVPSTSQEVADCHRTLTALELYQVIISPSFVDLGSVCVESVCVQPLQLVNRLPACVWVQLEVDCPELQGSSPLSYVLPPHTHTSFPLTFESNQLGPFSSSLSYSVNQQHPGQVLVWAQVTPMALEMSTELLVLRPTPNTLAASGYRSSVSLQNRCNCAVDFTWQPAATEIEFPFSLRPASGTVEPHKELDCEVVWFPSFSSPSEGDFDLCVLEGNTQRLHCVAKVGTTTIQLTENRIMFESVPLNITSTRTAVLRNGGQNHAYYQVLEVSPVPGMVLSPCEGVVPSKGMAAINIHFSPDCVLRFDAKVKIALRNMKSIELRVAGSVEPPNVDISVSHFQFSGVHTGSQQVIPFTLTNRSSAAARVAFDLSEYEDFSLQFSQPCTKAEREPGLSVVELHGGQTEECFLVFSPTQVASHDFYLPLMINGADSLSSFPSLSSTSPSLIADSRKHIKAYPHSVAMATQQPPWIQATALYAPLEMSPSSLQFNVEPQCDTSSKNVELKAAGEESVCWRAVTGERVHWWFDCSGTSVLAQGTEDQKLCGLSPSSGSLRPGQTVCLEVTIIPDVVRMGEKVTHISIPLFLGVKGEERTEGHRPYRQLSITVILEIPSITFCPRQILLTPVPLAKCIETTLTLLAEGYQSGTTISAEVDEVEMEDGTKIQPVSVVFPEGNTIQAQNHNQQGSRVASLLCSVSFRSAASLSLCTSITFTDHVHNRFQIKLCAAADNCLLTVWPHMALRPSDQQMVLKKGSTEEVALQYCPTPHLTASGPAASSSSSSAFDHNSSTYKNSDSCSYSVSEHSIEDTHISPNRDTPASLGIPEFPAASTEAGQYYQSVLLAVERWFSFFGWPSGPHPISVPHTLRRVVSKSQTNHNKGRTYAVALDKDTRSVVEMLHYLTGIQIPGIGLWQVFSSDVDQRTNQLLHQHKAMLTFLRIQGACLCHIRPEYLLDVLEFKHWCSIQSSDTESGLDFNSFDYESLSKRSWTDVLLQLYKVVVLCRVSAGALNTPSNITDTVGIALDGSQILVSNVYSPSELRLLSWLNMHYEKMRKTVWGTDGVPSARWIVNFDLDFTDGLVLAALLAAYCPYLIKSHFRRIYTTVSSLEHIIHNNIVVAQALTTLGVNMDIQLPDLSDSNPVQMLVLCVHLYEMLPNYLPSHTITLSGGLHSTVSKQVHLKNPSSKLVKYQAFILGEDAHFFSLPNGSIVNIPPKSNTVLTVRVSCFFLQPMKAVLLLSSILGLHCATLTFNLKTHISHITPTNIVQYGSPCYQLGVTKVPIMNKFSKEANFSVVLVESNFNPLEPETKGKTMTQQEPSNDNMKRTSNIDGWEIEDGEGSEFLSTTRSVSLQSGQEDTLRFLHLPFFPGTKYCTVLLTCPQVGDMVCVVKATAELPLPSPLFAKPSCDSNFITKNSDTGVSVLRLHCKVGAMFQGVLQVPRVNMPWEKALVVWAQHCMSAGERKRRLLTHTLDSSTVRESIATQKFTRQQFFRNDDQSEGIKYEVEISLPQYFTLPRTVTIPTMKDTNMLQENPADGGCVNIPLRFQADSVGQFTSKVVLRSFCDIRVFMLEAVVTLQDEPSSHNDRAGTAHVLTPGAKGEQPLLVEHVALSCPVGTTTRTQLDVPNNSLEKLTLKDEPSSHNDRAGTAHVLTPGAKGEQPLLVEHVALSCPVGTTTRTQLDVPNNSLEKLTLKVETNLSVVSGAPTLKIKPGQSCLYTLAVTPWKRGKQTGSVSFVETDDMQKANKDKGNGFRHYAIFYLELICEPAAPVKVITAQCVTKSSVTMEIPVSNPGEELLMLDVFLEGDNLTGAVLVSVPPRGTVNYNVTFSPVSLGKITGSVVFQSEQVGEFWYRLELYALPTLVIKVPQARCQLGKWVQLNIPLVNPTSEILELIITNTNPQNYTLEMDSKDTLTVEPRSCTHLGVRFSPSAVGPENHEGKITFTCSWMQEWCVLLSGCGLKPVFEEPLCVSSVMGSSSTITVSFTNPTELPATLTVTLTDEDPNKTSIYRTVTDRKTFSCPLSHTEAVHVSERATVDVPVVFAPTSVGLQLAWLYITMKPISTKSNTSKSSTDRTRSEEECWNSCWIYPLYAISTEVPAENSPLGVVQCEVGRQLVKTVEVQLSGYIPQSQDQKGHKVSMEDFRCQMRSDSEAELSELRNCLSITTEAVKRNPENGVVILALRLVYTPLRTCRCLSVLVVQSVSGRKWEFPIILTASKRQVYEELAVGVHPTRHTVDV